MIKYTGELSALRSGRHSSWFRIRTPFIRLYQCPSEYEQAGVYPALTEPFLPDISLAFNEFPTWVTRYSRLKLSTAVSARKSRQVKGYLTRIPYSSTVRCASGSGATDGVELLYVYKDAFCTSLDLNTIYFHMVNKPALMSPQQNAVDYSCLYYLSDLQCDCTIIIPAQPMADCSALHQQSGSLLYASSRKCTVRRFWAFLRCPSCSDSGRPWVSSAADFHQLATADAAARPRPQTGNFLFQLHKVVSEIRIILQTSSKRLSDLACLREIATCYLI